MKKTLITIISLALTLAIAIISLAIPSLASNKVSTTPKTPTTTVSDVTNDVVVNDDVVADVTNDVVVNDDIVTDVTNDVVVNDDVVTDVAHTHEWKLLGHGELGFTVVCACGNQYSSPFTPCEHALTIVVDGIFPDFHAYECENCCYYARMQHEFDYFFNEKNHYWACIDCGYVVSESAHTFEDLGFNESTHTQKCTECGYITSVEHQFIAEIEGDFTVIHCDSCDYISEKRCNHNNVYMIDELYHVARCLRCNEFVDEQHTFFDGVCECGYEAVETTQYGILTDYSRNYDSKGDRVIEIEMMIDHEYYYFHCDFYADYREWINEGSFVEIKLNGNEVYSIEVLVNYDVVDDYENFKNHTSSRVLDTYSFMGNVDFEDLIIENVDRFNDELEVEFERLYAAFCGDYEVYDLRDGEMGRLREGDAVLYFTSNTTTYFIVIW